MAASAPFSVLVVDDNAAIRQAIARSLARKGGIVTTGSNGIEGLDAIRRQAFDAVITDLNMPERGGLWLWQQALEVRPELRGRFLLISSEPTPEPRTMDLVVESERFILKPFSLESLWEQLRTIIGRDGHAGGDGHPR